MKCPLSPPSSYPDLNKTKFRWADCLKEECAWYDREIMGCGILVIDSTLALIAQKLGNIAKELTLIRPGGGR